MRIVVVLLALAGCDKLFDIDHIGPGDGGHGGSLRDGDVDVADAFVCTEAGHDEDVDFVDDACDPCPTIMNSEVDDDHDGLPNACDRDNAATGLDRIIAYWTFPADDLSGFAITGMLPVFTSTNNGMMMVTGTTTMATSMPYALTRVDFHVSGVAFAGGPSELSLQVGTNTICSFTGAFCDGTSGGTCIHFGSAMSPWSKPGTAARVISLYQKDANVMCSISDGGVNMNAAGGVGTLLPGEVGFTINATVTLKLEAIVIYGSK